MPIKKVNRLTVQSTESYQVSCENKIKQNKLEAIDKTNTMKHLFSGHLRDQSKSPLNRGSP